jgi:hypothetical protein
MLYICNKQSMDAFGCVHTFNGASSEGLCSSPSSSSTTYPSASATTTTAASSASSPASEASPIVFEPTVVFSWSSLNPCSPIFLTEVKVVLDTNELAKLAGLRVCVFSWHISAVDLQIGVEDQRRDFEIVWDGEMTFTDDMLLDPLFLLKDSLVVVCLSSVRWNAIFGLSTELEL